MGFIRTAAGVQVEFFESVGSTNTEVLDRARAGARGPLWIVARRQDSGRGRRGRNWVSEPGNLYATLLLTDPSPPARAPELSFVSALAIHDAVFETAPAIASALSLKWPNDLLLGGKKFAGILIEGERVPNGNFAVAVGVGVNCTHHPDNVVFPATDLSAAGAVLTPDTLFQALAAMMQQRVGQWARGEGFATIRRDWLARGPRPGGVMNVRLDNREIAGRFETIDETGQLVLRLHDNTIEKVTAGEIFASGPARQFERAQR